MESHENEVKVIELLIQHEEAIRELYLAYANKFMDLEEFWFGIAQDEKKHAEWIRGVLGKMQEGPVRFNADLFKNDAVQDSLDFVKKLTMEADGDDLTLVDALKHAFDLEKTMIEEKFFEIFEGIPADLATVLKSLIEGTKYHVEIIEKELTREQGRQSQ